jgi:large conductance mechanosensitive channel
LKNSRSLRCGETPSTSPSASSSARRSERSSIRWWGDVLSPIIGAVTGGFDFSNYFIPLSSRISADSLAEAKKQGAVLAWGNFLTVLINFIIIAWVLFIVVRVMNRVIHSEPQAPALSKQEMLLTEIRDLLKRGQER